MNQSWNDMNCLNVKLFDVRHSNYKHQSDLNNKLFNIQHRHSNDEHQNNLNVKLIDFNIQMLNVKMIGM